MIRTVGVGDLVEEEGLMEDEEKEKESLSLPATPGSETNVTSLIRDAKTMQRGRRGGGRVGSDQDSCCLHAALPTSRPPSASSSGPQTGCVDLPDE